MFDSSVKYYSLGYTIEDGLASRSLKLIDQAKGKGKEEYGKMEQSYWSQRVVRTEKRQ